MLAIMSSHSVHCLFLFLRFWCHFRYYVYCTKLEYLIRIDDFNADQTFIMADRANDIILMIKLQSSFMQKKPYRL